jgi:hypothetical protein
VTATTGRATVSPRPAPVQVLDAIDVAVLACDTTEAIVQANRIGHQTPVPGEEVTFLLIALITPLIALMSLDTTIYLMIVSWRSFRAVTR